MQVSPWLQSARTRYVVHFSSLLHSSVMPSTNCTRLPGRHVELEHALRHEHRLAASCSLGFRLFRRLIGHDCVRQAQKAHGRTEDRAIALVVGHECGSALSDWRREVRSMTLHAQRNARWKRFSTVLANEVGWVMNSKNWTPSLPPTSMRMSCSALTRSEVSFSAACSSGTKSLG